MTFLTGDNRRRERPHERLDRNFTELLQELRVAQTGVQVMFAFLLTLPFAARFARLPSHDRVVYVAVLAACAAAIIFLIAPVIYHRMIFRQDRKAELVTATSALMLMGVACLLVAIVGAVFLVMDVVLDAWPAAAVASGTALLAVTVWYAVPVSRRPPQVRAAPTAAEAASPGHVRVPAYMSRCVEDMITIDSLDALAALVADTELGCDLYVRWSRGPAADLYGDGRQSSRDELTGIALPGLSASPLRVEPWWHDRPLTTWVARRLYDYRHLQRHHGGNVRPWVFLGHEQARGPDNEPLVICTRPIAWVSPSTLHECEALTKAQPATYWGPLDRTGTTS
jgi:hypothetical protein